ncbi:response regulator [Mesobacillus foraminis]|uniref:Two-component system CitB family response regulator/CitB family two-component system response regulator MalR n=1 Tax=Mesobacillus foraminis TaxID=279826 RepID=A0A4R2BJJ5_9BACI|nr:response regulator [Mesobacillus foraminis]TCN26783.1 two-component system CitB family response regulator/CitB family two-component system response regulator MalR [Mesobacillus foraminis]
MIKVLIVEDDPMVAELNKRYLMEVEGFLHGGSVETAEAAIEFINRESIDLVLLDVYMPGGNGLEFLTYVRERKLQVDVIMITAASDAEKIQTALRYGAADYLIKPFEFERFQQALSKYKEKRDFFQQNTSVMQKELDEKILGPEQREQGDRSEVLPKGLTKSTLQSVIQVIQKRGGTPFSTDELAEDTGISKVSVRKYLKFLTEENILEESLTYGIGRPVYLYKWKGEK